MDAVKAGGNRQELHEEIRRLSMEAGENVKKYGMENNLLQLIAESDKFPAGEEELKGALQPSKYTGRAASQVEEYINEFVKPVLDANKDILGIKAEITV